MAANVPSIEENLSEEKTTSPDSKTVVLVLCFFLGCVGGHRWYTGKGWTAFLQLITCFFSVGSFKYVGPAWVLIDFIMIASDTFRDKKKRTVTQWITSKKPKLRSTAMKLCAYLGFFGAHRYYVGKAWTGLLLQTLFGLSIDFFLIDRIDGYTKYILPLVLSAWLLIDFATIFNGRFRDKLGRPLSL